MDLYIWFLIDSNLFKILCYYYSFYSYLSSHFCLYLITTNDISIHCDSSNANNARQKDHQEAIQPFHVIYQHALYYVQGMILSLHYLKHFNSL